MTIYSIDISEAGNKNLHAKYLYKKNRFGGKKGYIKKKKKVLGGPSLFWNDLHA
jgi:hypothetical protein